MAQTTLKLCGCKFMPIVEFVACISLTDCIQRKNYLPVQQKQAQQHGGIAVPQHHQKPESTGELEMQ